MTANTEWDHRINAALVKLGNREVVLGGVVYDNGNGSAVVGEERKHRADVEAYGGFISYVLGRRPRAADHTPHHLGGIDGEQSTERVNRVEEPEHE